MKRSVITGTGTIAITWKPVTIGVTMGVTTAVTGDTITGTGENVKQEVTGSETEGCKHLPLHRQQRASVWGVLSS
jgi:hypothetical protein